MDGAPEHSTSSHSFFAAAFRRTSERLSTPSLDGAPEHSTSSHSFFSAAFRRKPERPATPPNQFDGCQVNLSTTVSPDLRRGVNLNLVLRRFGRLLQPVGSAGTAVGDREYKLSRPVLNLDFFLSHDWHTPHSRKFVALLVFFNLKAAGVAASVTSLLVVVIEAVIGRSCWIFRSDPRIIGGTSYVELFGPGQVLVPIVYMIVLLCWQDMRGLARKGTSGSMFLDKVCIQQTDTELKQAGIRSLAGILRSSDRMVVLYSDAYFSRLWCVYELASWLYLKPDALSTLTFVPVGVSQTIHGWAVGSMVFYTSALVTDAVTDGFLMMSIVLGASIFIAWSLRLVGDSMQQMLQLSERLKRFQVRESQCYCCSVGHVDPDTREGVPCDRKMVYEALRQWAENSDEFLDEFDTRVRGMVQIVLNGLERNLSSYRMSMAVMVAPAAALMLRAVPFYYTTTGVVTALRMTVYIFIHLFAVSPMALRLSLHSAIWICPKRKLLSYVARWFFMLSFYMITLVGNSKVLELESPVPQLVYLVVISGMALCYYQCALVTARQETAPTSAPTETIASAVCEATPSETTASEMPEGDPNYDGWVVLAI